jgi:AcrR family transcriptional regulator
MPNFKAGKNGNAPSRLSQRRESARSDNYQARRGEVISIAAAVFKEKGYDGATLKDIADHLGHDRAALYYYVGSKRELFQEIFQETAKKVLEENLQEAKAIQASDAPVDEKLSRLIKVLLESYEENYPYIYVYIQEDMKRVGYQDTEWAREMARNTRRMEAIIIELIETGVQNGAFRGDLPVPVIGTALFGMVNWTHRWFKPGGKFRAAKIAEAYGAILNEGLKQRVN